MKSKNGFFTKTDGWQYKIKKSKESTQPVTLNYAPPTALVQKRHPPWFHKISDYCTQRGKKLGKCRNPFTKLSSIDPTGLFLSPHAMIDSMPFDKFKQKSEAVKTRCICCGNAQYNMSDLASFVSYFFLERILPIQVTRTSTKRSRDPPEYLEAW